MRQAREIKLTWKYYDIYPLMCIDPYHKMGPSQYLKEEEDSVLTRKDNYYDKTKDYSWYVFQIRTFDSV